MFWRSFIATTLRHDGIEILGCDVAIIVEICFLEDFVNLVIGEMFSELGSNLFELLSVDFSLR